MTLRQVTLRPFGTFLWSMKIMVWGAFDAGVKFPKTFSQDLRPGIQLRENFLVAKGDLHCIAGQFFTLGKFDSTCAEGATMECPVGRDNFEVSSSGLAAAVGRCAVLVMIFGRG